jgi:hypothetical protein
MRGRAIAQAVSRWLATAAARVRARVWSCGICGGQSGAGAGFLRVLRFPLSNFIPPIASQSPSSIIWGLYNRPEVAAVPRDLVPPHKKRWGWEEQADIWNWHKVLVVIREGGFCRLFHYAFSIAGHIALNGRTISQNWKTFWSDGHVLIEALSQHLSGGTAKNLNQDSMYSGRESNYAPPEQRSKALPLYQGKRPFRRARLKWDNNMDVDL